MKKINYPQNMDLSIVVVGIDEKSEGLEGIVTVSERVAGKRGFVVAMTAERRRQSEARRQQFADTVAESGMDARPDEVRLACSVLRRIGLGSAAP